MAVDYHKRANRIIEIMDNEPIPKPPSIHFAATSLANNISNIFRISANHFKGPEQSRLLHLIRRHVCFHRRLGQKIAIPWL
jgi:hypothetical protein